MARKYVVMGVSGSGKSSIGDGVARAIGGTYVDGDDLHPKSNIDKMARGEPLEDADRAPWLDRVGARLAEDSEATLLIGCSALKRAYRDRIRAAVDDEVTFIHLAGPRELIESRMSGRSGHFMPATLLDSQFATLEVPGDDESSMTIDIDRTPEEIVEDIVDRIRTAGS